MRARRDFEDTDFHYGRGWTIRFQSYSPTTRDFTLTFPKDDTEFTKQFAILANDVNGLELTDVELNGGMFYFYGISASEYGTKLSF